MVGGLLLIVLLLVLPLLNEGGNLPSELNPISQPAPVDSSAPQIAPDAEAVQNAPVTDSAEDAPAALSVRKALDSLSQQAKASNLRESILGSVTHGVTQIFLVMIIFFFMLSAAISMPSISKLDLDGNTALKRVEDLTKDVRSYMSITTGINFLVGAGDTIFLMIMGVPYAILWGLLAWIMGYIPTVGFWFALIPPVILAYTQQGLQTALIVFAGYVLINGTVQNFIQPRIMGQGLGISPVVIFISLFVWGWLLGGIGAILAVPLTLLVMAVLKSFDNTRWIVTLMAGPPPKNKDGDEDDDKKSDHEDAKDKLRGFWEHTKRTIRGDDDGSTVGEDADNAAVTT